MLIIREPNLKPIKIWASAIEDGALEQARHLAALPFAFQHIALMPDTHQGFGMPIGGVLAAQDVIVPNAVGVDIGCGVRTCQLEATAGAVKSYSKQILEKISKCVPTGFTWHKKPQASEIFDRIPDDGIVPLLADQARYQLGTLGGGNHFIELQEAEDGTAWVMVHTGSRNLGKKVADYYNQLARELNASWRSPVPREWQLAYLPLDTKEGQKYYAAMQFCHTFAQENRALILKRVLEVLEGYGFSPREEVIDVHHNYASLEEHFNREVVVHRKGAVRAEGRVIVPGSMGSPSYIGEGLKHPESFWSCSHGAGRVMGRREAIHRLSGQKVQRLLAERGVTYLGDVSEVLDEAPQAYKDIDMVMREQADLVRPLLKLRGFAVIKAVE